MNDLTQRLAALPPEKLALLERRLSQRLGQAGDAAPPAVGGNGRPLSADAPAEAGVRPPDLKQVEQALEQHPAIRKAAVVPAGRGRDGRRLVAYLVPEPEHARPVLQILRLEKEGRLSGRPRYELPGGQTVIHLNRSETEYIHREIFEEQAYLRHNVRLPAKACVFDVGAHIGLFTLFVSRVSPGAEVYAFEPLPPIFDALQLNASIYDINVKLFDFGLGDSEGTASFSYYPHASVLSGRYADAAAERQTVKASLHTQRQLGVREIVLSDEEIDELLQAMLTAEQFSCPVRTLSQVIREHGVEKIDLLKIDVEKSEHDVLAGVAEEDWPRISQVVMEVHDIGGRLEQIVRLLEAHGFRPTVEQDAILRETNLYNVYAVRPEETPAEAVETRAASARPRARWGSPESLIREARRFAAEQLPEHLRPDGFVLVHDMPLKPDGEINYAELSPPEEPPHGAAEMFVAPRTAAEKRLAGLWAEILGLERVSIRDNFFALGGDWWQATRLIARARQLFGVKLSPRDLSDDPTVAGLALTVSRRAPEEDAGSRMPEVDRLSDEDVIAFLSHLSAVELAAEAPSSNGRAAAAATFQNSTEDVHAESITRIDRGASHDLLTSLDLLFDEEVDSFLTNLFTEEEISDAYSAINSHVPERDWPELGNEPAPSYVSPRRPDSLRTEATASAPTTDANAQRMFEEAHLAYTQRLQESGWDAQRETAEAHLAHFQAMREAFTQGESRDLLDEAAQQYTRSLQLAHLRSWERMEEAYLKYLEDVRDLWLRLDVEAIGPGHLMAISHGMMMVANFAAGVSRGLHV